MLQLSERLQQNIAFILRRSRELEEQAAPPALSQPGKLTMLCYSASELALTALISSDELESLPLPREAQLLQREAASALRQIALHALDIQAWELPDAVRAELAAIRKQCETLVGCVELPPEPEAPAPAPLVPARQAPAQAGARDLILFTPAAGEDEETLLRAQIRALRDLLASLVQERDELVHVTCRELEARYYRELGSLEAEVFRAEGLVHFYRRRAEYLRAARNRDEKPDVEKVEEKLRKDLEEYQKVYEEFTRRAKEAEAQRPKRTGKSAATAETKSDEKASDPQEPEEAEEAVPSGEEEEAEAEIPSEEERLKRLYRRIVKAMHPDLHPEQDEATRTLFKRAIQAYKDGDLKTLQEIDGMCADTEPEPGQDPLQALREEKQRLLDLVFRLRYEIRHIKTRFPYTKKALLEDPEQLAAKKRQLELALFQFRQQAERYRREAADLEGKS